MKKRVLSILFSIFLLASPASAAVCQLSIGGDSLLTLEADTVIETKLDAPAFLSAEGRTMVPLRATATALGALVDWEEETRTVTLTKGEKVLSLSIGSSTAFLCGETMPLDSPPVIVEDRTMVPLRFISEALSAQVQYLDASRTVLIDDSEILMRCDDFVLTKAQFDGLYALFYVSNEAEALGGGMTKAAFSESCLNAAYARGKEMVKIEAAFPEVTVSPQLQETIFEEAASFGTLPHMPLSAMRDLVYLRVFKTGGEPIYTHFMAQKDAYMADYAKNFVCAKHVLCADEETAKLVYEKAMAGESFDALIEEYNTDPGMDANPDGYVFTFGEMVKPFEDAAFNAKEGEITPPVETAFGYHVLKRLPLPTLSEETLLKLVDPIIQTRYQNAKDAQLYKTLEALLPLYEITE